MKKFIITLLLMIGIPMTLTAQEYEQRLAMACNEKTTISSGNGENAEQVFMFSYFTGNGEDGLHLAYSYDGYNWKNLNKGASLVKPKVGNDKLMRDPCIIRDPEGTFHMVWTVSWSEKGIGYAHSKDLINWSEQKYIPVMKHESKAKNCWAPEIFYDQQTKRFMIVWATTIPGRFPETDNPETGYNHRLYYTTTKNFDEFSETQIFYNQGFNVIDGTIDKIGSKYYMFLKDERNQPFTVQKNIRYAVSDSALGSYSEPSKPITGDYWAEGPTAIKVDTSWIVYFDKYTEDKMGAVKSSDLKNWQDISDKVHFPEGTQHGTVFRVSSEILNNLKELSK